jgi:hypothetical protein
MVTLVQEEMRNYRKKEINKYIYIYIWNIVHSCCKKLKLEVEYHPGPYHVAWITKVDKHCLVTFEIHKAYRNHYVCVCVCLYIYIYIDKCVILK